jgi:hypothetical protein
LNRLVFFSSSHPNEAVDRNGAAAWGEDQKESAYPKKGISAVSDIQVSLLYRIQAHKYDYRVQASEESQRKHERRPKENPVQSINPIVPSRKHREQIQPGRGLKSTNRCETYQTIRTKPSQPVRTQHNERRDDQSSVQNAKQRDGNRRLGFKEKLVPGKNEEVQRLGISTNDTSPP